MLAIAPRRYILRSGKGKLKNFCSTASQTVIEPPAYLNAFWKMRWRNPGLNAWFDYVEGLMFCLYKYHPVQLCKYMIFVSTSLVLYTGAKNWYIVYKETVPETPEERKLRKEQDRILRDQRASEVSKREIRNLAEYQRENASRIAQVLDEAENEIRREKGMDKKT